MRISSLALLIGAWALFSHAALAEPPEKHGNNIKTINRAFHSGEKLTYSISWSKILQAGVAVMEVRAETTTEGEKRTVLPPAQRLSALFRPCIRSGTRCRASWKPRG